LEVIREKEIKEQFVQAKRVMYPLWAIAIIINSLLVIGYYYQDKLIAKNAKKLRNRERNRAHQH